MMMYVLKRLGLMIPTLFLILGLNFTLVHLAPTSPIHTELVNIHHQTLALSQSTKMPMYQGADGLSDEMAVELNQRFGFDRPAHERFGLMIKNYLVFDLGVSFFKGQPVATLIKDKLPMTLMFGGLCLVVMYGVGVGVGVTKAMYDGRMVDRVSTVVLAFFYAVPSFVLGVSLLVLFAGGRFWQWFPMQVAFDVANLPFLQKITTALYELFLPVIAGSLSGVAGVAYLTKFSLLHEKNQPYVKLAKSQGFSDGQILKNELFKNAMLPVVSDMHMVVMGMLFFGNFIMEVIFGIDGLGRLGYEAMVSRDYPVMFGLLYVFTLLGMMVQLIFDVKYQYLDARVIYT